MHWFRRSAGALPAPPSRRARGVVALPMALAAFFSVVGCGPDSKRSTSDGDAGAGDGGVTAGPSWTVVVYGHGDHNLSNSLLADMQEMASAQLGARTKLVVLADWDASQAVAGSSPPEAFPSGTEVYVSDPTGALVLAETYEELDFDDPYVLRALVGAALEAAPSDRRAIILWDHGGSWRHGFGGDQQNGTRASPVGMSVDEVVGALRGAASDAGITEARPYDLVAFDTCLMATQEVAYAFRDLAGVFIGDAELDYGAGWDYATTLTYVDRHRDASAVELAAAEVAHWDAHHRGASLADALLRSHAAIDLTRMQPLSVAAAALVARLGAASPSTWLGFGRAIDGTRPGYLMTDLVPRAEPELRDVGQLLTLAEKGGTTVDVAAQASAMHSALDEAIVASSQGSLRASLGQLGMHGELPLGAALDSILIADYEALAGPWSSASGWGAFLKKLHASADRVAPTVQHLLLPDATLPTIAFATADADVSRASAYVFEHVGGASPADLVLGLSARAPIEPDTEYSIEWSGTVTALPAPGGGLQRTTVDLVLDLGADPTTGAANPPLLGIHGVLTNGVDAIDALLIFQDGDASASLLAISEGGGVSVEALSEWRRVLGGGYFVPSVLSVDRTTDELTALAGSAIPLPAGGAVPLTVAYVPAGDYGLLISVADLWGNETSVFEDIHLPAPLGP